MFGLKSGFGIARQKQVKMIHGSEKINMGACSQSGASTAAMQENILPYVDRSLEVEIEKARALAHYRRMLDTIR